MTVVVKPYVITAARQDRHSVSSYPSQVLSAFGTAVIFNVGGGRQVYPLNNGGLESLFFCFRTVQFVLMFEYPGAFTKERSKIRRIPCTRQEQAQYLGLVFPQFGY